MARPDNSRLITGKARESLVRKMNLIISMAGTDTKESLTALSYALVHLTVLNDVSFSSVVRNLAEIYETHPGLTEGEDDADN